MKLLALAYPELSHKDFDLIQSYRKEHDSLHYLLEPHFTLVFPVHDFTIATFTDEIKTQLKGIDKIKFSIRAATINKDAFAESYYVFLVPDEGHSGILRLHDKLYSGKLSKHQRLDIDFIPHITIGNSTDISVCKKMVDHWNKNEFEITGAITSVDIVKYEKAETIKRLDLPLKH